MSDNDRKWAIGSSQAYGSSYKEPEVYGVAKFTASYDEGPRKDSSYSVEVRATFDPETKEWKAEIVKQWKGRF